MTVIPNARRVSVPRLFDWGGVAKFSLQIVLPRSTLHANHRWKRAYPGIPYVVRVAVHGGVFPFLYELINAPAGMTIGVFTGWITWSNPQVSASNISVRVTDSSGATTTSATWSITVATTDFLFLDAVNGNNAWDGTAPAFVSGTTGPKQTISAMQAADVAATIWYFRNIDGSAVYNLNGTGAVGSIEFEWDAAGGVGNSIMWLGYPGDNRPKLDLQHVEPSTTDAPFILFQGPYIYIQGFECYGDRTKVFEATQSGGEGAVFLDDYFHTGGPGQDGSNAAFIMTTSTVADLSFGMAIQSCTFGSADHNDLKIYTTEFMVIEDCVSSGNGGYELKADVVSYCVRRSTISAMDSIGIGGNMNGPTEPTGGEICFCHIKGCPTACLNVTSDKIAAIGPTYIYRNTIEGRINFHKVETADGLRVLERNVIVNSDGAETPWPFVNDALVTDASRVQANISSNPELSPTGVENLAGAASDAIIDANGLLQGSHRDAFRYRWGHEVPA